MSKRTKTRTANQTRKRKPIGPNPRGETFNRVVEMFRAGKSVTAMAKTLGRSRVVVYHHIRNAQESGLIEARPRNTADVLAIIAMLKVGEDAAAAARKAKNPADRDRLRKVARENSQAATGRKFALTRQYINQVAIEARDKKLLKPKHRAANPAAAPAGAG